MDRQMFLLLLSITAQKTMGPKSTVFEKFRKIKQLRPTLVDPINFIYNGIKILAILLYKRRTFKKREKKQYCN